MISLLARGAPAVLFLALWEAWTYYDLELAFLLGSPSGTISAFCLLLSRTTTWISLYYSCSAIICGLALGMSAGIVSGLLLVLFPSARRIAPYYLLALGSIPTFALAPLMVLTFGIGWGAKVALATLGSFLLSIQLAHRGAALAFEQYQITLLLTHANKLKTMRYMLLPAALTWIVEGYRSSVTAAVMGVFFGEVLNSSVGIGHMLMQANGLYHVNESWACVLILILLTWALSSLAELLPRRFRTTRLGKALNVRQSPSA